MPDRPIAFDASEELAEAYSDMVETKPHNALYERPATLSLLPDVKGLRVLDAGCGPGIYAEILSGKGAQVVGFDRSPKMVKQASDRVDDSVQILQADLSKPLNFAASGSFDIVVSSLVLDYVKEWEPVFREFNRVLCPDGLVVFSADHPFDNYYRFTEQGNYYEVEKVEETWTTFGFELKMLIYRRPLGAMINSLISAGFRLEKVLEATPTEEFSAHYPEEYERLCSQPGFICFRARKMVAP